MAAEEISDPSISYLNLSSRTDLIWCGAVSQKSARGQEWQQKWIGVFKSALYCYKEKVPAEFCTILSVVMFTALNRKNEI